ncbi:MAG: hypothetical protein JJE46_05740 [Acidimicrobiia bacterium]|nr:hypothetical protein [Acidimicrobiia bacterium]
MQPGSAHVVIIGAGRLVRGGLASAMVDIGADVTIDEADAEFSGLLRLSPAAMVAATRVIESGSLGASAGLPALIDSVRWSDVEVHGVDLGGEWSELDAAQDLARFVLGTKAESLERAAAMDHGATIGAAVSFTRDRWATSWADVIVLGAVRRRFYEGPSGTGSRVDVEAVFVGRPGKRQLRSVARRIESTLAELTGISG